MTGGSALTRPFAGASARPLARFARMLARGVALLSLVALLGGLPTDVQAAREETLSVSRVAINFIDVLVVRPVTLATTAVGSVLYAVTFPITYWREDDAALDMLVKAPFDATFRRCLGCPAGEE